MAETQDSYPHSADDAGAKWIADCETLVTTAGHHIAYRRRGHGHSVLMLHGFPTWSYDYAAVAADLEADHDVITMDFLGYGASDKPNPYEYSVAESADIVEQLVSHLGLERVNLVCHDYGAIVGQELLDRHNRGALGFDPSSTTLMNCAIVYSEYRPMALQEKLADPEHGERVASGITSPWMRAVLDGLRGVAKVTDVEFDNLWAGMSRDEGHKLAHLLIRYNAERDVHHERWETALQSWNGPLSLVWGLRDPVSGSHVLERATELLPNATVTALDRAGHFPQAEAPAPVAAAIRAAARP
ncbi:hypothetical protein AQJ46_47595 [Streptomyces canus]|uniref:AB hydrolase-1 domain-containing protein n=1 Tax=Streptomyces canus TaxID=58343 RepID=A0A101RKT7_9ACTN|nr:alpha/beta hydrolase [Streptomyces canus]KUN57409.1 hypothetical protein AQJ46_47595 [Streptomyces canus]